MGNSWNRSYARARSRIAADIIQPATKNARAIHHCPNNPAKNSSQKLFILKPQRFSLRLEMHHSAARFHLAPQTEQNWASPFAGNFINLLANAIIRRHMSKPSLNRYSVRGRWKLLKVFPIIWHKFVHKTIPLIQPLHRRRAFVALAQQSSAMAAADDRVLAHAHTAANLAER